MPALLARARALHDRVVRLGARRRAALAIGIAALAGLALGLVLVPRVAGPGETEPAPPVTLLGEPLPLGDGARDEALARVRRWVARRVVLELPDDQREEVPLGRLGAEIDLVRLHALVRDAADPTSALRRVHAARGGGPLALPVPVSLGTEAAIAELLVLKDRHDRTPVDARLDLEKKQLVPEVVGRLLDVDATLLALRRAVTSGEPRAAAVFVERAPRRRASELANVDPNGVLGWFETPYDRSERYAARTFNLRLAASKLDGWVLLPGELLEFNTVVGPRDEANGYKVAPVIAQGELVDGIGGGTCQISGTLHGAALFAGLEIVQRVPHTRPSSYIKMGLDATVVYPTIDFKVRNPFPFPVVIHETVKSGVVRAEILGPARTRTVTLIRRIEAAVPYEQVEREDDSLPEGARVLAQRGVPGFKVRRYRIVRDGDHAVRERWHDVYPPTAQIVRVGTGKAEREGKRAADDSHGEYVADELLVLTQTPGSTRFQEQREPGTYGKPGWTKEAGMPFWERTEAGAGEPKEDGG
ncbi:MAG: VanW family protein [Polyangiaceae bacterium]|nr:VanW family protein [Polyangiaceae bacterium]